MLPATKTDNSFDLDKTQHSKNSVAKFMTYNIHSGIGRDKVYRLDRTIDVIRAENPDVVALQEVDNYLSRSQFDNQSKIIADELGMHYQHCVNRYIESGEYGISTLSRFPIMNQQKHDLSYKKRREPRGTLRTDLKVADDFTLHVFNVHLGLSTRERRFQRSKLLSDSILLDKNMHDAVVLLGDFNDKPISVVHQQLRLLFTDAFDLIDRKRLATFKWGPLKFRLDHIYFSKYLKSVNTYVVHSPLARITSDHLPVVTEIAVASQK